MKKFICLLGVLLMVSLLVPVRQAEARGQGWFLPGLIIGGVLGWGLAPRYYHPPAYRYPPPPYYYPPPAYAYPPPDNYPPPGEVRQAPPSGGQVFIYPRHGQSQEKLESDRDACHSWAVNQTGYDPHKPPPGDMSESQMGQKSSDYLRALDACLDARGYSVR